MMPRSPFTITPYFPTSSGQFGRGGITVFRGSPIPHVQYGRGFGCLFKSMGRLVTPLIGKAVRYAGKTGLETGIGLLSDVLSGENVKTAAKTSSVSGLSTSQARCPGRPPPLERKEEKRKVDKRVDVIVVVAVVPRLIFLVKTTTPRNGLSFSRTL